MTYWLDLFTGTTLDEFQKAGANVSGFDQRQKNAVKNMRSGDILLCYLTHVQRWVGALEVVGPSTDTRSIWKGDRKYPCRVAVKSLIVLPPENGVLMDDLRGKTKLYEKRSGFMRGSARRINPQDGDFIIELLRRAEISPVKRPVDAKKLAQKPYFKAEKRKGKETISTIVTVPAPEEVDEGEQISAVTESETRSSTTRHTEIQHHLMTLGAEMGFDIWVARNDRSRNWNGKTLGELPNVVDVLPAQFNEATNRTIELIDVLWLKGNSIVAAFEVECTTSVYSGLLRMSDLLALQPNLTIDLFLVAPDERREKVKQEILRPTFSLKEKPLAEICGFISFGILTEKLEGIRKLGLASSLKADFLLKTAEFFAAENSD